MTESMTPFNFISLNSDCIIRTVSICLQEYVERFVIS